MQALGVDLAERYSAAVLLDHEDRVLFEATADFLGAEKPAKPEKHFDSIEQFGVSIFDALLTFPAETVVWVEDVGSGMINTKPAVRAQAVLMYVLDRSGVRANLVMATRWQRDLGYSKKEWGTTKAWAKALCAQLGYEPSSTGKGNVDLRDAYLLSRWARGLRAGDVTSRPDVTPTV